MGSKKTATIAPEAGEEAYLQIGEVAERTGVTQRTLRFYEEKGLLKPPSRLDGGFRLYSEDDVQRVEQIKRLQRLLGFTLADIKEMVEAAEEAVAPAPWAVDVAAVAGPSSRPCRPACSPS